MVSSVDMSEKSLIVLSAGLDNKLNYGKKRQAKVSEWSDNKRKKLRNSGQSYINRKGKEVKSKRRPGTEFLCSCHYPECRKICIEEKKTLFENFYTLNYDEQSQFLKDCMEIKKPLRRTVPEATSRRNCTVKYTVQLKLNKRVQVCKKSLCNMLDVTKRRLGLLLKKIKHGENICDQRGKHLNRPRKIKGNKLQHFCYSCKMQFSNNSDLLEHIARHVTQPLVIVSRIDEHKSVLRTIKKESENMETNETLCSDVSQNVFYIKTELIEYDDVKPELNYTRLNIKTENDVEIDDVSFYRCMKKEIL